MNRAAAAVYQSVTNAKAIHSDGLLGLPYGTDSHVRLAVPTCETFTVIGSAAQLNNGYSCRLLPKSLGLSDTLSVMPSLLAWQLSDQTL
jgi:hypothetical protein